MVKCKMPGCPGKKETPIECVFCQNRFHISCEAKVKRISVCSYCELRIQNVRDLFLFLFLFLFVLSVSQFSSCIYMPKGEWMRRSESTKNRLLNSKNPVLHDLLVKHDRSTHAVSYAGMDGPKGEAARAKLTTTRIGEGITQVNFF